MNKEKMNYEQRLLHVTVAAGILFSVIEVMMAIYTNSQAVLMDSIYDLSLIHLWRCRGA